MGKKFRHYDFTETDRRFMFYCPGCECGHAIRIAGPEPVWQFNGDVERPTVSPSILVNQNGPGRRCHSWITNGMIKFLDDCHHKLKGSTVELPDNDIWGSE